MINAKKNFYLIFVKSSNLNEIARNFPAAFFGNFKNCNIIFKICLLRKHILIFYFKCYFYDWHNKRDPSKKFLIFNNMQMPSKSYSDTPHYMS